MTAELQAMAVDDAADEEAKARMEAQLATFQEELAAAKAAAAEAAEARDAAAAAEREAYEAKQAELAEAEKQLAVLASEAEGGEAAMGAQVEGLKGILEATRKQLGGANDQLEEARARIRELEAGSVSNQVAAARDNCVNLAVNIGGGKKKKKKK